MIILQELKKVVTCDGDTYSSAFSQELTQLFAKHKIGEIMQADDQTLAEYIDDHLDRIGEFMNSHEFNRLMRVSGQPR